VVTHQGGQIHVFDPLKEQSVPFRYGIKHSRARCCFLPLLRCVLAPNAHATA
jgi:hypothetical protein